MDEAFNQHSPHVRRRSSPNLKHLTLAPLTSRLPIDTDIFAESNHGLSYIEGRSAPTTPSILGHPSRNSFRKSATGDLARSKSSTQLPPSHSQSLLGSITPGGSKRKSLTKEEITLSMLSDADKRDSDWLHRAGAALSTSTRESKGQTWLVSRASSTSLISARDDDDEFLQRERAREREQASRRGSRRGSATRAFDADDEASPAFTRRNLSFSHIAGGGSRPTSRHGSRLNSRRGSRTQLFTPISSGTVQEGYFDGTYVRDDFIREPDFVDDNENYDEREEEEEGSRKDEAVVKRLAQANSLGIGGIIERMLGWSLFAVDEDGGDGDADPTDEKEASSEVVSRPSRLSLRGIDTPIESKMPPLNEDSNGGWQDAAWLLTVATKVIF